ncbi:hypothetical protein PENTCL1PPCAC_19929, partial [Pristionchus entomophagus]
GEQGEAESQRALHYHLGGCGGRGGRIRRHLAAVQNPNRSLIPGASLRGDAAGARHGRAACRLAATRRADRGRRRVSASPLRRVDVARRTGE